MGHLWAESEQNYKVLPCTASGPRHQKYCGFFFFFLNLLVFEGDYLWSWAPRKLPCPVG